MPRIANIIQIAKQMVKAKVLDHSTRQARGSETGGLVRELRAAVILLVLMLVRRSCVIVRDM
jgi:hypothetical protein